MTIDHKAARKLSVEANKAGAAVLGGQLVREGNRYMINKTDVTALLETLLGQNVLLFVDEVEQFSGNETRTCISCGDEYSGAECPRCARVRERLRGT
jgi:hypothetical protein